MTFSHLTVYRPRALFLSISLGFVILASWFHPTTRIYWDALDLHWFNVANGSLRHGEHWQYFWAITNHRAFDAIPGSLLLIIFALSAWKDHRDRLAMRIAIGIFMALYCVATIQIARLLVLEPRLSPTLVLEHAYRLSELVPSISSKDNSTFSFPGDHATVMLLVSCFILYFCGKKYGIAALIVTLIFSIPRTVGGAHWLTDVVIGGSVITLLSVPLALFTPLGTYCIDWIDRHVEPYLTRYFPGVFRP